MSADPVDCAACCGEGSVHSAACDAALDAANDAEEAAWGEVRCARGHTLRVPPGSDVPVDRQRCWCGAKVAR